MENENKINEEQISEDINDLSPYVKELLKPENLIGEFTSTEEMFKVLSED